MFRLTVWDHPGRVLFVGAFYDRREASREANAWMVRPEVGRAVVSPETFERRVPRGNGRYR